MNEEPTALFAQMQCELEKLNSNCKIYKYDENLFKEKFRENYFRIGNCEIEVQFHFSAPRIFLIFLLIRLGSVFFFLNRMLKYKTFYSF